VLFCVEDSSQTKDRTNPSFKPYIDTPQRLWFKTSFFFNSFLFSVCHHSHTPNAIAQPNPLEHRCAR